MTTATCEHCGVVFTRRQAPQPGKVFRFCSKTCTGLASRKRVILVCQQCGVSFPQKHTGTKAKSVKFCSRECIGIANRGENHYNFKGGRNHTGGKDGYISVLAHDHPRACHNRIHEHVLIAERALGRFMPEGAEVHHVDGNGLNNTPSNLVICQDHSYHFLLECRGRRLRDTGSLDMKRCETCKEVKPLEMFYNCTRKGRKVWDGKGRICKSCNAIRGKAYKRKLRVKQEASPQ